MILLYRYRMDVRRPPPTFHMYGGAEGKSCGGPCVGPPSWHFPTERESHREKEDEIVFAQSYTNMTGHEHQTATRSQVVILKQFTELKNSEIEAITGISVSQIQRIVASAKAAGYEKGQPLFNSHVETKKRSGRPTKINDENTAAVLNYVRQTKATRSANADQIAEQSGSGLSKALVLQILKKEGMHKVKRTTKPGLNVKMRSSRLQFALKYKDWTLDQWKRVAFTDETSVVLGHRRGGDYVWRTQAERNDPTVLRRRWGGYSEFMFWGCFSYNFKGPCHCWTKETAAEKRESKKELETMNKALEEDCKAQWELETATRRMDLNRRGKAPGRPPVWSFSKKNGKLERGKGSGGVDWWRYRKHVLQPKLIPFALKHGLIIQQDGAPSHREKSNQQLLQDKGCETIDWPGNSPDLNMIEPCWPWMKRESVKYHDWEDKKQIKQIL